MHFTLGEIIASFYEVIMKIKIKVSQKQLDKIADQLRILSWAQGAIATQLHFKFSYVTILTISLLWLIFQTLALYLERDKNG